MMQPELSQQERDRQDESITAAMDTLEELKRLTSERQKAVDIVQATLGSFERVSSDEFFGLAPWGWHPVRALEFQCQLCR